MIHFEFDVEGELLTRPSVAQGEAFNSTNQLIFPSNQLQLQMHEAETMVFEVGAEASSPWRRRTWMSTPLHQLRVRAETVSGIVAIEAATGEDLTPCIGAYDDVVRVHLRQRASSWEESGRLHPRALGDHRHLRRASPGDSRPTRPTGAWRHSRAHPRTRAEAPRHGQPRPRTRHHCWLGGPEIRDLPPDDRRFLAWSPSLRDITGDQDLVDPTPWGLIGIDEEAFPR
jgi:hypothetical protein